MTETATGEVAKHFYEFDGYRFYPGERLLVRVRDGHPFTLMPKANALLFALVRRCGEVVTYAELKKEVWADAPQVLTHTIRETKHALAKVLGESAVKLETVAGKGYRFNVEVVEIPGESAVDVEANRTDLNEVAAVTDVSGSKRRDVEGGVPASPARPIASNMSHPFAGHLWHVMASCSLYALLYVIALFVETAYQYGRFGVTAWKLAPLVFLWILTTSVAGLAVVWRRTIRAKSKGLALPLMIFIGAGLLLYVFLGPFIPDHPITEANFQTYTAHGAYLKSVCYFLFLAVVFIIIPYHFVLSLRLEGRGGSARNTLDLLAGGGVGLAPGNSIYLRVWWLGLFLFGAAIVSPVVVAHLFDNLRPNVHMNLFMQLVIWRTLLFLFTGLECLLWYYRSLSEIKRECLGSPDAISAASHGGEMIP